MATTDKIKDTEQTLACLELEINNVIHHLIQQQTNYIKTIHLYRGLISQQLEDKNKYIEQLQQENGHLKFVLTNTDEEKRYVYKKE